MDRKIILNEISAALDARAALEMMSNGRRPVEHRLADNILLLLDQLIDAHSRMTEISEDWVANGITQRIGEAALAGKTVAGYSPADWARWGNIMPRIMGFLTEEYISQLPDGTTVAETPKLVLRRDYQPVQTQEEGA